MTSQDQDRSVGRLLEELLQREEYAELWPRRLTESPSTM
jgi:hypothetical protein